VLNNDSGAVYFGKRIIHFDHPTQAAHRGKASNEYSSLKSSAGYSIKRKVTTRLNWKANTASRITNILHFQSAGDNLPTRKYFFRAAALAFGSQLPISGLPATSYLIG
jgi:hypothetical protein